MCGTIEIAMGAKPFTTGTTTSGGTECITCPDGYTLEDDNTTCTKIVEQSVTLSPTIYSVGSGDTNSDYGRYGGRFYTTVDNSKLPIKIGVKPTSHNSSGIAGKMSFVHVDKCSRAED